MLHALIPFLFHFFSSKISVIISLRGWDGKPQLGQPGTGTLTWDGLGLAGTGALSWDGMGLARMVALSWDGLGLAGTGTLS